MFRRAMLAAVVGTGLALGFGAVLSQADAAPRPAVGFRATVLGWTSWYGSYDMGSLGRGFCVDHGSRAPDPSLVYVPTVLGQSPEVTASLAWLYGANGAAARTDRVVAAAVMLAGHDLVGARYPRGRLDLGAMTAHDLAGFSGNEGAVLTTARRVRAEAVAHANLIGPLRLTLSPGGEREAVAALRDAEGRGVGGVSVEGTDLSPPSAMTGPDGTVRFRRTAGGARVEAVVPDMELEVFRASRGTAQRVAVPATSRLSAGMAEPPPPPLPDGRIRISKRGVPGLSVAGARFELRREGSAEPIVVTTGEDGDAGPVAVRPGPWTVTEVEPPPGYQVAGPWTVDVLPARERHLEVINTPARETGTSTTTTVTTAAPTPDTTTSTSTTSTTSTSTTSTSTTSTSTTSTSTSGPKATLPPPIEVAGADPPPIEPEPPPLKTEESGGDLPRTGRGVGRVALIGGALSLAGVGLLASGGSRKRRRGGP